MGYKDGSKKYIVCPRSLKIGMDIYSGSNVPIEVGNAMPLELIPLGSIIHNVELTLGKGGRSRWLGKKPKVRGVVKNPIDHPHGGGEGRSPIGRPKPVTPWGKPALGIKTRKQTKASSKYILRSRR